MEIIYVVVDEKGKKYGGFRNIDDVEEFRLHLFMEYGLDSFLMSVDKNKRINKSCPIGNTGRKRKDMENYNVLEEIENLMEKGYSEEDAGFVTMLGNYDIPLEDIFEE